MDGISKAGKLEEARSIVDDMKGKGVLSDGYANSIMISALCRSQQFEEAKELSRDSETTYEKCDLVMLNTVLCAYCRAGEMGSVMRMMKKMDEQAISYSNISLRTNCTCLHTKPYLTCTPKATGLRRFSSRLPFLDTLCSPIKRSCSFNFYNGYLVKDTLLTPPQETSFSRTLICLVGYTLQRSCQSIM